MATVGRLYAVLLPAFVVTVTSDLIRYPTSPATRTYVDVIAPLMFVQVVPPSADLCQVYV